jgi:hypothetical protein
MSNGFGLDLGLNFDLSFGYEAPYYTELNYAVSQPSFHVLVGGTSWLTFALGVLKFNILAQVEAIKFTPFQYSAKFNVQSFKEYCHQMSYTSQGVKTALKASMDVDECAFGLGGIFTN